MVYFKLCVVRHGETPENKNNIYQGQIDTFLSEEGNRQVELVAQRLQDEEFSHAYSSDLQRAYKTGEHILQKNKYSHSIVLVKDPRIREKAYGVLEGKSHECVKVLAKKHNLTPRTYIPEGGETVDQLKQRTVSFFDEMCKNIAANAVKKQTESNQDSLDDVNSNVSQNAPHGPELSPDLIGNVLVACHGGTIRQLITHFAQDIKSEFLDRGKQSVGKLCPNTGVSRFDVRICRETGKAEFVRCTLLYDGSHLTKEEEKVLYEDRAL